MPLLFYVIWSDPTFNSTAAIYRCVMMGIRLDVLRLFVEKRMQVGTRVIA